MDTLGERTQTMRWRRKSKSCRGKCVRQALQRTCARAYRRGPAGPARVERQQHHASPPPQHALGIPFSDARQPSKVLGSRAFAKDGFLWRARPRARKSHRFLREKRGFDRAHVKKVKERPTAIRKWPETQAKAQFLLGSPGSVRFLVFSIFRHRNHGELIEQSVSPARRDDFQRRGSETNPGDRGFLRFVKISEQAPFRACCRPPNPPPDPIDGCPQKTSSLVRGAGRRLCRAEEAHSCCGADNA